MRGVRHGGDTQVAATGIDGCGAPLFAVSLRGLTRAFCRLASTPEGSLEHRVARAMSAHPRHVRWHRT
ncbi:asparaginase [Streptomyces sp. NPDC088746]|uniref:asparaginase n=1 Tax=Streptomyces sp. NPDC088746 TaxID=3365885 RepID=UPI003808CEB5